MTTIVETGGALCVLPPAKGRKALRESESCATAGNICFIAEQVVRHRDAASSKSVFGMGQREDSNRFGILLVDQSLK